MTEERQLAEMYFNKWRRSGDVQRLHIRRYINEYTVGHHSWDVAMITAMIIGPEKITAAALMHALTHDMPEMHTGDMPGHIKANNGPLKALFDEMETRWHTDHSTREFLHKVTQKELYFVGLADRLELLFWCVDQGSKGNTSVKDVAERSADGIRNRIRMGFDDKSISEIPEGSMFRRALKLAELAMDEAAKMFSDTKYRRIFYL